MAPGHPKRPRISVQTDVPRVPCREVAASLWEFLDGELQARRAAAVRAHLAVCPSCRARQAAARELLGAVARVQRSDSAPDSLRKRVAALPRERGHLR